MQAAPQLRTVGAVGAVGSPQQSAIVERRSHNGDFTQSAATKRRYGRLERHYRSMLRTKRPSLPMLRLERLQWALAMPIMGNLRERATMPQITTN